MGKHTLTIEYDYDFVLIGISSHEKDYRICWAINNKFDIELKKIDSLEIKGKKQTTPSFFSLFKYENQEQFIEYFVLSNLSESKSLVSKENTLFKERNKESDSMENEWLIPENKQMDYFFVIRGEIDCDVVEETMRKIKDIDIVLTAVCIDVTELKSKQNLIF